MCAVTSRRATTTTPFNMVVLNRTDHYPLVNDVIDRVPMLGERAAYLKQAIRDKLQDHKQYIAQYGDSMPDIRDWRWGGNVAFRSQPSRHIGRQRLNWSVNGANKARGPRRSRHPLRAGR